MKAQSVFADASYTDEVETGTLSQPFKTIQQAVDAASPGETVFIRGGIYREYIKIGVNDITIQNYEDEKVVVSGAEPVLEWENVTGELYKAVVPWDITENDQSLQVFVDGEMIHLTRWPKQESPLWAVEPTYAYVDEASNSGTNAVLITDDEFDEPKERWLNGMIWVNLANGHDGNGWTGKPTFISSTSNSIKVSPLTPSSTGVHAATGHDPWAIQRGTSYYFFNPTAAGVYATGGPDEVLARGEWWKTEDTLYIKLPNGESPASTIGEENMIEVKKRIWAFSPAVSDQMNNVTIKGIHLFAATITTDRDYARANLATSSYNNIIDSISGKYIMHFIDQSGHYGLQWKGRCGIILSGVNNKLQNSAIKYSAGSGVSLIGEQHKVLNNSFYENNYQATEAGVVCSGPLSVIDPEVGNNFFYNTAHIVIVGNRMRSSNPDSFGLIRIHHNVINNFMMRSNDGGAINFSAGRNWERVRVDHNVIFNSNQFLSIGIYTDYGGEALFDHNLIYNVDRPIQMNRYKEDESAPVGVGDGPMGEIFVYNNTVLADNWSKPGILNNHKNPSGEGMTYKNNLISNKIGATLELGVLENNDYITESNASQFFEDFSNDLFTLNSGATSLIDMGSDVHPYNDEIINSVPDIGAFEYGADPWIAGPENVVTDLKITAEGLSNTIYTGDTVHFSATAYTGGFMEMEPQPELYWYTDGNGTIDEEGQYIATKAANNAYVFVTADSFLVESKAFKIELSTSIDNLEDNLYKEFKNNGILDFSVFPNPASDYIKVNFKHTTLQDENAVLSVFDMKGSKKLEKQIRISSSNESRISTEQLKNGLYIIQVSSDSAIGYKQMQVLRD